MKASPAEQPSVVGGDKGETGPTGATGDTGATGATGPIVSVAPARVLGNPPEATAAADAAAIDGAAVGAMARRSHWEAFTLAPGKYTLELDPRTHWVEFYPTGTGDVEIEAIRQPLSAGAAPSSSGAFLRLVRFGSNSARRVVLKHEVTVGGAGGVVVSAAGVGASTDGQATIENQRIWAPQGFDLVMDRSQHAVFLQQTGRYVVAQQTPEPIAAGSMTGNQIDATATTTGHALTGAEQGENIRGNTRQTVASASGTIDVLLAKDTTILVIQSIGDVTLRTLGSDSTDGRWVEIEHERTSGTGVLTIPHNTSGTYSPFFNAGQQPVVMGVGVMKVRSRSGFWRNRGARSFIINGRADGATLVGSTGFEYFALSEIPTRPAVRDSTNTTHRLLTVPKDGWREQPLYDDFDGQVADGSNVLKREPWIAYDAPIITQNDAGAEHSINHPGQLRLSLDATLADKACIYRGPWNFASLRAFGARLKIPSDGLLSGSVWGFGLVQLPTDMDTANNGGLFTDNNIVAMVRAGGSGAGSWTIRRELAGSGAASVSSTAVVLGTWYEIECKRAAAAGAWDLFVNGVFSVQQTGCPTTGLAYFALGGIKDAGAVGRHVVFDDCWVEPFAIDRRAA